MIDKDIGLKIKELRESKGITQIDLAAKIGVSFQQVQKYEKGVTRIAVTRLQDIARAMGVDLRYFFEESGPQPEISDPRSPYSSPGAYPNGHHDLEPEEKTLLRLFRRIDNKKIREGLLKQLRGIVETQRDKKA